MYFIVREQQLMPFMKRFTVPYDNVNSDKQGVASATNQRDYLLGATIWAFHDGLLNNMKLTILSDEGDVEEGGDNHKDSASEMPHSELVFLCPNSVYCNHLPFITNVDIYRAVESVGLSVDHEVAILLIKLKPGSNTMVGHNDCYDVRNDNWAMPKKAIPLGEPLFDISKFYTIFIACSSCLGRDSSCVAYDVLAASLDIACACAKSTTKLFSSLGKLGDKNEEYSSINAPVALRMGNSFTVFSERMGVASVDLVGVGLDKNMPIDLIRSCMTDIRRQLVMTLGERDISFIYYLRRDSYVGSWSSVNGAGMTKHIHYPCNKEKRLVVSMYDSFSLLPTVNNDAHLEYEARINDFIRSGLLLMTDIGKPRREVLHSEFVSLLSCPKACNNACDEVRQATVLQNLRTTREVRGRTVAHYLTRDGSSDSKYYDRALFYVARRVEGGCVVGISDVVQYIMFVITREFCAVGDNHTAGRVVLDLWTNSAIGVNAICATGITHNIIHLCMNTGMSYFHRQAMIVPVEVEYHGGSDSVHATPGYCVDPVITVNPAVQMRPLHKRRIGPEFVITVYSDNDYKELFGYITEVLSKHCYTNYRCQSRLGVDEYVSTYLRDDLTSSVRLVFLRKRLVHDQDTHV